FTLRTTLDSPIGAFTLAGDRLLVSRAGSGLALLDPARDFLVVGSYPREAAADAIAATHDRILVQEGNQLLLFGLTGNTMSPVAEIAAVQPRALVAEESGFRYLDARGLHRLAADGSDTLVAPGTFVDLVH